MDATTVDVAIEKALQNLGQGMDVSRCPIFRDGILGCVGNTPLITIKSLSIATGCQILGKCEFLNPGGSIKDRTALAIVAEAEAAGLLVLFSLFPSCVNFPARPFKLMALPPSLSCVL